MKEEVVRPIITTNDAINDAIQFMYNRNRFYKDSSIKNVLYNKLVKTFQASNCITNRDKNKITLTVTYPLSNTTIGFAICPKCDKDSIKALSNSNLNEKHLITGTPNKTKGLLPYYDTDGVIVNHTFDYERLGYKKK